MSRTLCLIALLSLLTSPALAQAPTEIESIEIPVSRALTLPEARGLANEANHDLKIVRESIARARTLRRKAWSTVIPNISAQGIYTFYDKEISAPLGPPGQEVVIRPRDELRAIGTISERFDGRVFPQLDNALMAEELATLTEADARRELGHAIAQLYFQLLALDKLAAINARSLESRQVLLKAAEARLEAGAGTEFEVTRAQTEVAKAQGDLERARLSFISGRSALALILVTEADFSVVDPPSPPAPASYEESVEVAMAMRPDLIRARLNVTVAENEVKTITWTYAPTLLAQFQVIQQEETAFNPDALSWQIQVVAAWTLYDGGLRETNISDARSRLRESVLQRDKLKRAVTTELRQAYDALRSHQVQLATSEREVSLAMRGLQQAQDGYTLGILTQLDVLNAEFALKVARIRHTNYELDHKLALFNISRLTAEQPTR